NAEMPMCHTSILGEVLRLLVELTHTHFR
ncbi:MAG: hypothetical protein QG636_402, partial [Patescibacteria group bacterium]|nr:hypothetical protein [Patescibacteria group bacterium]